MIMLWLLAQTKQQATPLEQLDPPSRAAVLMSLLALVLTGLGLILLTTIGARWVRRINRDRHPPRKWPKRDLEPGRPASGPAGAPPPEESNRNSSDTIEQHPSSDKTRS